MSGEVPARAAPSPRLARLRFFKLPIGRGVAGAKQAKLRWPRIAVPSDALLPPLYIRLLWMLGIWVASVSVLLVIA